MFNNQKFEFKPINYLGLVLALLGIGLFHVSESNNAYMMAAPTVMIIVGLFLILKGRKKQNF